MRYVEDNRAAATGAAAATSMASLANATRPPSFANLAPAIEHAPNEMLFQQGFPVREVHIVESGFVKLTSIDEDGNGLIVGLRSAESILGAAAAIARKPHPVTAVALTQCCTRPVSLNVFLDLAKSSNEFCWRLHQLHSLEIHYLASQLVGLKHLSARQRFEQLIWQLAGATESIGCSRTLKLHLPLKHWELAQLVGITPEHLSRVLKQMQQEKILFKDNGSLVIRDPARLYRPVEFS